MSCVFVGPRSSLEPKVSIPARFRPSTQTPTPPPHCCREHTSTAHVTLCACMNFSSPTLGRNHHTFMSVVYNSSSAARREFFFPGILVVEASMSYFLRDQLWEIKIIMSLDFHFKTTYVSCFLRKNTVLSVLGICIV